MTFTFPPLQCFESGTNSFRFLWLSLWAINIGLIGSIVGLWILKPRARRVWLMAEAFWIGTLLASAVFIVEPIRSSVFRELYGFGRATFLVIASLAFPAMVAGAAEISRSSVQSRGFRNPLIWVCVIPCSIGVLLNLYQQSILSAPRGAVNRQGCITNLKQIGLSMSNFHDSFNSFPDSETNLINGLSPSPDRSWRVELLPYLGHYSDFNAYDRASTWDSKKNLPVAMRPLGIYTCPTTPPSDQRDTAGRWYSAYSVLVGPETAFPNGKGLRQRAFSDGLSNTALVVEACGQQIVWTEPRDIELTDKNLGINLPGHKSGQSIGSWSSYHRSGAHTLLADGSVRFLSVTTDPRVLRAITTVNGAEDVGNF